MSIIFYYFLSPLIEKVNSGFEWKRNLLLQGSDIMSKILLYTRYSEQSQLLRAVEAAVRLRPQKQIEQEGGDRDAD